MKDIIYSDKANLETIFSLTRAMIEEKDLYSLLRQIHDQTKQVLQVDRCTIFLFDRDRNELWSWVSPDLEIEEIRLPLGQGIAGWVAASKEALMIANAFDSPFFDPTWDQKTGYCTNNILSVPMLARGSELVGVIEAINKQGSNFNDYDRSLLMTFASLAAAAIRDVERDMEREKFIDSVVRSFGETIDARSEFTAGHSQRVATYVRNFAQALGLSNREIKVAYYAALLHDVGKIGIKDAILEKPGRLTPEEYQSIKDHAAYTRNILNAIDFPDDLKEIPQIASSHHEQIDGGGYPVGLKDNQIHKLAKIISIADVYESLTARDRPYRKAMSISEALEVLIRNKGTCFDPNLVDLFIEKRIYHTELRIHKRISVDLAIEYVLDPEGQVKEEQIGRGRALNLSQSGLLFSSDIIFPTHKLIGLTVYIPNDRIEALAQVVWCREAELPGKFQVGLRFADLSFHDQQKLQRYLQKIPTIG
ncbi:MAG: HD domain-containing protein [bacterium]|nr:HD domain-containing protein [bacterium]